jgi:23S rRNA (cytosine1962-C5)-methyltransferase
MTTDNPSKRPIIALEPRRDKRVLGGHPWVYSNEVRMDAAAKALPPGSLVTLATADSKPFGVATFNPHTLVSARLLDRDPRRLIDTSFFIERLENALALRRRLYGEPFYRLIHAEADGLPGVIVDRFGDLLVCQLNTAGMAQLQAPVLDALVQTMNPRAIVLRDDSPARAAEGLTSEVSVAIGTLAEKTELVENGARFLIDPAVGQKTGWFYDQRENRRFVAGLASGARVLDVYCFLGGFSVLAALGGADAVLGVDRSDSALALAAASAEINAVDNRCRFARGEAFAELARLAAAGERFDVVIADPPAFVKSKKDLGAGLRGYRKLVRLAAALVAPKGLMFIASCSHNVSEEDLAEAVRRGHADSERGGKLLRSAGAAPDHPVHPWLPESAYLKSQVLALD